jgi:hypothetical protein
MDMFIQCTKYEVMLVVVLEVLSMTTLTSLATTSRGTPGSHASNFLSYQNVTTKLYISVVPLKACYTVQSFQALTGCASSRQSTVHFYRNLN